MRLPFFFAMVLTMVVLGVAYGQQSGTRVCSTTTSGSISHEYCSFTPLVVAAPAVTVQPAQVTVQPRIEIKPTPTPAPAPAKIKN